MTLRKPLGRLAHTRRRRGFVPVEYLATSVLGMVIVIMIVKLVAGPVKGLLRLAAITTNWPFL